MTSVVDTSVKFAVSSMQDAPVINGTAGSLIAALDAFLVNGFANKSVTSGVVSGGVCRLSFTGQSAAMAHSVILVAGMTGSHAALNGEQKVTAVSSSWVEFKTDLPDGAVTGAISFKMAPLGWEKVFTGANKAVYRSLDPSGSRPFVRIDDSNASYARVQMYESMSDIDTGVGVAPALAGGHYWYRRQAAGAVGTYWMLIGDSRGFYYTCAADNSSTATTMAYGATTRYVGDIQSYRSGDAWGALISGSVSSALTVAEGCVFQDSTAGSRVMARAYHGIGSAINVTRLSFGDVSVSGASSMLGAFPSKANNGIHVSPILVMEGSDGPRGELPGALHCPQSGLKTVFRSEVSFREGAGPFRGRTLMAVGVGTPGGNVTGIGFFDVTGPWRS